MVFQVVDGFDQDMAQHLLRDQLQTLGIGISVCFQYFMKGIISLDWNSVIKSLLRIECVFDGNGNLKLFGRLFPDILAVQVL